MQAVSILISGMVETMSRLFLASVFLLLSAGNAIQFVVYQKSVEKNTYLLTQANRVVKDCVDERNQLLDANMKMRAAGDELYQEYLRLQQVAMQLKAQLDRVLGRDFVEVPRDSDI